MLNFFAHSGSLTTKSESQSKISHQMSSDIRFIHSIVRIYQCECIQHENLLQMKRSVRHAMKLHKEVFDECIQDD